MLFATGELKGVKSHMILDPTQNKYQESQMLFFNDRKKPLRASYTSRPKTIAEIKKIQGFVKNYQAQEGQSLQASISNMAKRDESFNDFLRNFKAKNEKNWANIIDMTQHDQEEQLLAKSPEYRKNEMIMLEELRRRKKMKDFYKLNTDKIMDEHENTFNLFKDDENRVDRIEDITEPKEWRSMGPERHFERKKDEIFDFREFTLIFIDSDSVTNVTSLNRVNHRRVLIFIGNGAGLCSYGKGKSEDYE
jgi:hypothetical protein